MFIGQLLNPGGALPIFNMDLHHFVRRIKDKPELSSLDDGFVLRLLRNYLSSNPSFSSALKEHPSPFRSALFRTMLKEIRRQLREVYGVFQVSLHREKMLDNLLSYVSLSKKFDEKSLDFHQRLLSSHKSTKERLSSYNLLYKKLFPHTHPKKILDLGCGLNPFSYPYMGIDYVEYFAVEASSLDCLFLQRYFDGVSNFCGLRGLAIHANLLDVPTFPSSDVCFLFKVLDSLESLERNITFPLLSSIDASFFVASFPTKTLSGKPLSKKRLTWFLSFLDKYEEIELPNEVFYIFSKSSLRKTKAF